MALEVTALDARVQIKLNIGVDEEGKDVLRLKTYNRIKSTAADQDIYDVADALTALQGYAVVSVKCISEEEYAEV